MTYNASISVVIPCYNCSVVIERAVNSVLNQTLQPIEIIFVDDCSSDETLNVIRALNFEDTLIIRVISLPENSGPAHARNVGLDVATGNYIAFLDSDDTWHPDKLKTQYGVMAADQSIALSGHRVCESYASANNFHMNSQAIENVSLLSMFFKNKFNTPSVMIKQTTERFPEELRYAEDYALWLNIASSGSRVVYISEVLAFVHKPFYGSSGLSASLKKMHSCEINVLKNFQNSYPRYFILIEFAILFAKIKYLRRLIITRIRGIYVNL